MNIKSFIIVCTMKKISFDLSKGCKNKTNEFLILKKNVYCYNFDLIIILLI